MAKTYYEELGVESTAGVREIKRQYRALAQQSHPDQPGGSDAAFMALQQAYDTLIDPERRAAYDAELAAAAAPGTAVVDAEEPAPSTPAAAAAATPTTPASPAKRWHLTWFRGMVAVLVVIIAILFIRIMVSWSGGIGPSNPAVTPDTAAAATPTATPSATPTDTPTATPTPTDTPLPSDTPTPVATDTPTPTPDPSSSPSPLP